MKKQGFTLIKMLAVILVAGILTAAGVVNYNTVWRNHWIDTAETDLRDISSYLINYGNITILNDINYETIEVLDKQYLNYEIEK